MIIKNYKFGDIHQLLREKGFIMIKKARWYLENLLNMFMKIKKIKNYYRFNYF